MDGTETGSGASRDRRPAWAVGIAVAVTLGVALVVVLSSGGEQRSIPAAKLAPGARQVGVSVNRLFNGGTYPPAQIAAQLAAVLAPGAPTARGDAVGEASEPTAPADGTHHYD